MTHLYLCPDIDAIPAGVKYRVLCDDSAEKRVIESDTAIPALTPHPPTWANGVDCVEGCIADWRDRDKEIAEIDAEIDQRVDLIVEAAYKWPAKTSAKLKSKVDKATTEGLLSADGKPITISDPQGWKK